GAGPGGSGSSAGTAQPARNTAANSASHRSPGPPDHIPRWLVPLLRRCRGGLIRRAGRRLDRCGRSQGRAPEPDSAGQPVRIWNDRDVRRQWKGDVLGVAAAEVEVVEAHNLAQDVDDLRDPLVPGFCALLLAGGIADVFIVGFLTADRVVGEFEMRDHLAVAEDGRAGSGAEGQYH